MKKRDFFYAFILASFITSAFFYKTIFFGRLPFPGDLLVSEYKPWQTSSYLGYIPGSIPHKAQYPDTIRQLYPWKTLSLSLLKKGELPLWNPYNFSGAPLLANFQSAIFYPLNIFYFLFDQKIAWSILIIIEPLFAFYFTYLFCRAIGLKNLPSVFSSSIYGFSSFMSVWLQYNTIGHVILWLPIVLLSVFRLTSRFSIKWVIIFVFSLSSSLLAGHIQVFGYLLIMLVIYIYFLTGSTKKFMIFLLLIGLTVGLSAVQVIPGIELIFNAARSPHTYAAITQKVLLQPWHLIMLIVPDFFGNPATRNYLLPDTYIGKVTSIGMVPLFFILIAMHRMKEKYVKFFFISTITVLILVTLNPITSFLYKFNLPIISSSSPTLMMFIFSFSAAILAGYGIQEYMQQKTPSSYGKKILLPLIIIIVLWISLIIIKFSPFDFLKHFVTSAPRNLLYSSGIAAISFILLYLGIKINTRKTIFLILLVILHIMDQFIAFHKFNPFVSSQLIFPSNELINFIKTKGIDRFWGYGNGAIQANFATQYSIFSPEGYDPLYPKLYGDFIHSSKDGKLLTKFTNETRSDAFITPGYGEFDMTTNTYRLRILDTIGVRYILDRKENNSTANTFPPDRFNITKEINDWKIIENKNSLPRVFLTSSYVLYDSKQIFEEMFFQTNKPLKTILLTKPPNEKIDTTSEDGNVQVVSYEPNTIFLNTDTPGNKLLFISDTFYPGWKAYIDQEQTEVLRANYAFRAVFIPKGKHVVKFIYQPQSFATGLVISIMSFVIIVFSILYLKFSKSVHI